VPGTGTRPELTSGLVPVVELGDLWPGATHDSAVSPDADEEVAADLAERAGKHQEPSGPPMRENGAVAADDQKEEPGRAESPDDLIEQRQVLSERPHSPGASTPLRVGASKPGLCIASSQIARASSRPALLGRRSITQAAPAVGISASIGQMPW